MKKDELEQLFDRLEGSFDTQEPTKGHEQRFLTKLNGSEGLEHRFLDKNDVPYEVLSPVKGKTSWWKPLAVAASIALLCTLTVGLYRSEPTLDQKVAEISPEVTRTQFYFAGLIEQQIEQLESEDTPETRKIIDDTMGQLQKLKSDYAQLERDLVNGGNSKLILSAMITNFHTRIDLLQEVLDKIESIKTLKNNDEKEITI